MRQSDIIHPQGKLGSDLPDSEEALFEIGHFPLFDMELGVDILESEDLVKYLLESFDEHLKPEVESIKENHAKENWQEVEKLVHKIKGSATYGTVRLYFAFLFMERYLKAGHHRCQEALYAQMFQVLDETLEELREQGILH